MIKMGRARSLESDVGLLLHFLVCRSRLRFSSPPFLIALSLSVVGARLGSPAAAVGGAVWPGQERAQEAGLNRAGGAACRKTRQSAQRHTCSHTAPHRTAAA